MSESTRRKRSGDPETLIDEARDGSRPALARLLSMVEMGGTEARAVSKTVFPQAQGGHLIGITGAPGSGKSTLTSALCRCLQSNGARVGVLAVDPSSPFSGGAILGDRVRMGDHVLSDDIFIRSMATRGHLGGLSVATPEAARVMAAANFNPVIVETVGVGQVEVDVAGAADTTVVVVNPGWGDAVQAAKAGLMEIADIFVINKADRDGAGETRRDIESMLAMSPAVSPGTSHGTESSVQPWRPPVIDTVATEGPGVEELAEQFDTHRMWLAESGEGRRKRRHRVETELRGVIGARLAERAAELSSGEEWESAVSELAEGSGDPWSAAETLSGI